MSRIKRVLWIIWCCILGLHQSMFLYLGLAVAITVFCFIKYPPSIHKDLFVGTLVVCAIVYLVTNFLELIDKRNEHE